MDTSSIIKKIKALLALSKSDNQNEALSALGKANELMTKYQIEVAETEESSDSEVLVEGHSVEDFKVKSDFLYKLFQASARLFDCQEFSHSRPGNHFSMVGNKLDLQMAIGVFEYLVASWKVSYLEDLDYAKTNRACRVGGGFWTPGDTLRFKSSHGHGFAHRVLERVKALVEERKSAVSSTEKGKNLIVVKSEAVDRKLAEIGVKRTRVVSKVSNVGGFEAGIAAGSRVSLSSDRTPSVSHN